MRFRVSSIDETYLQRLDALEKWLSALGLQQHDRLRRAIENVRQADEKFLRGAHDLTLEQRFNNDQNALAHYLYASLDVVEFLDIFDAFQNEPSDVLVPKLKRALDGPFSPALENIKNNDGRNTQFELALAAEWTIRAGCEHRGTGRHPENE
jgi:hypothetical protein